MAYNDPEKKKIKDAEYRIKNREKIAAYNKNRRREFKSIVLNKYGNVCTWCGYDDIRALQIDHINNNGAEERKSLGGKQFSGWRFYEYLIKQDLPDGYQTLCANCNQIKQLGNNF